MGTGPMDSQLQLAALDPEAEEQAVAALLALGSTLSGSAIHQPESHAAGKASGPEGEVGLPVPPVVAAMQSSAEQIFAALFGTQMAPVPSTAAQMDRIEPRDTRTASQKPHSSHALSVLGSSAQRPHMEAAQPVEAPSKRRKREVSDLDAPAEVLGKRQRMSGTAQMFHFNVGAGIPVGADAPVDMEVDESLSAEMSPYLQEMDIDQPSHKDGWSVHSHKRLSRI